jgi:hypothetical protein
MNILLPRTALLPSERFSIGIQRRCISNKICRPIRHSYIHPISQFQSQFGRPSTFLIHQVNSRSCTGKIPPLTAASSSGAESISSQQINSQLSSEHWLKLKSNEIDSVIVGKTTIQHYFFGQFSCSHKILILFLDTRSKKLTKLHIVFMLAFKCFLHKLFTKYLDLQKISDFFLKTYL